MTIQNTQHDDRSLETKIPDEVVNVLGRATKALKKLAAKQHDRPARDEV
jgi:hypothetical protein